MQTDNPTANNRICRYLLFFQYLLLTEINPIHYNSHRLIPIYKSHLLLRQTSSHQSEVIAILEEKALESGAHHIELSAQIQAKDFYKKLGYTEIGEIYKEEFCPHIKMFKDLK